MKAAALFFLVVYFWLTVSIIDATGGDGRSRSSLEAFLSKAVNDGILSKHQMQQLVRRATDEGFLLDTLLHLPTDKGVQSIPEPEDTSKKSMFLRLYNQFTLLNVIYFSGALLIMGAYTLLMTLAWEKFGGWGIAGIMSAQCVVVGAVGVYLWSSQEYQFVGGLLCTISVSMVPFAVYGVERALDWWPKSDPGVFQGFRTWVRPGWVVMEVATVIVGAGYVSVVRFPFLLAPVSFSLWFLSMDLAPLLQKFEHHMFKLRVKVSLVVGLGMMCAGRLMEWELGSDPDFGFWLYLFGLIAFWFSLTFDFPRRKERISLYLLINVCLILVGSHLDRYTFKVFGSMGLLILACSNFYGQMEKSKILWIIKSLAVVALFAQAIKHNSNLELVSGLFCFINFNLESLLYVAKGEMYSWFVLLTNLGFVASVPSFSHPLYLWLFTVDAEIPVSFICSLSVGLVHVGLAKYFTQEGRLNWGIRTLTYLFYRLLLSTAISFVFVFIGEPAFACVGGIGIPLTATAISAKWDSLQEQQRSRSLTAIIVGEMVGAYVTIMFGIVLSVHLQSNILYLACCLAMIYLLVTSFSASWRMFGCFLSVTLILISVPLQSKFLIAIGTIYIFMYLSYLAYEVFKNSMLFPIILVGLGLCIIGMGMLYQKQEEAIYQLFMVWLPQLSLTGISGINVYPAYKNASFSFKFLIQNYYLSPLWPAVLIHSLAKQPAPYVTFMCACGIVVVLLVVMYLKIVDKLKKNLSEHVEVEQFEVKLCKEYGLVATVSGTKKRDLAINPSYIALTVGDEWFWRDVSANFGKLQVNLIRGAFLPYKLTPHLIQLKGFDAGSEHFVATISLGTGDHNSQKLSRSTIISVIERLQYIDQDIHFTLLYSNSWYMPYSKLGTYHTKFDDLCTKLLPQKSSE